MKILVTGTAGFIGYHVAKALLERGDEVIGLDNINNYYDPELKFGRLADSGIEKRVVSETKLISSQKYPGYRFIKMHLEDEAAVMQLCQNEKFDKICHLAAQAGVRYSLKNPMAYINSNIVGFANILEAARHTTCQHLVYASSSSVYGLNKKMPFSTADNVDHPVSLYAASKKSNELMAHTYSHLYDIPTTGLRFFTVYGPWGRPDMAIFLFTKAIIEEKCIEVFNNGDMKRDFTYIDDIVNGVIKVIDNPPNGNHNWSNAEPELNPSPVPYRIYNIGNSKPVKLMDFIDCIERELGKKAVRLFLPLQPGDMVSTYADVKDLERDLGYYPNTEIRIGVQHFVEWYKKFYKI